MRFTETPLSGAFIVEPEPRGDDRGFFTRLWCQHEFAERGLKATFVQCNGSFSPYIGTLRGLHYQAPPYEEVKLVRCVRGAVFDVIVDLRRDSTTYLQWFGLELSAENRRMVYVPEGCAHGYLTIQENSEVVYPVSQFYQPEAERGVRWDDKMFGIDWPDTGVRVISNKDRAWPDYTP
jgi:dTDP-4-dehydrorhamnose 3,5-epimerase